MDKQKLINKAADFVENSADNYISEPIAISANVAGSARQVLPVKAEFPSSQQMMGCPK